MKEIEFETMELSPIPKFLQEFLFIEADGCACDPETFFYHFFYGDAEFRPTDTIAQKEIFIQFLQLAKKYLDLRQPIGRFSMENMGRLYMPTIETEEDLLALPYKVTPEHIVIHVKFDIPMYWFDETTGQLGKSLIPCGCRLKFDTYPSFGIAIVLEFFLFSNHLRNRDIHSPKNDSFIYFEPAAKLNRNIFQHFIKEVERQFPHLCIGFETMFSTIPPIDVKYGFPDNAEDAYYEPA